MHLQKDWTKLKAILRVIDWILLAAVVLACGLCLYYFWVAENIPELDYRKESQILAARKNEIEGQIGTLRSQQESGTTENDMTLKQMEETLAAVQEEVSLLTARRDQAQSVSDALQDPERMKQLLEEVRTEYGQAVRQLEDQILAGESDYRICYLTFDDGPSLITHDVLDKLAELDAHATFFTTGVCITDEKNLYIRDECLRREAREGHTIANHTFTHNYDVIYKSAENFLAAVEQQDELVYGLTGLHTNIVRFPSGSYYGPHRSETIQALQEAGYQWMDWIGNAYDTGTNRQFSSKTIANTVIRQARQDQITVILMHDWNFYSLGALEKIVTTLREENYLFLPLFKESSTNCTISPKWD